MFGSLFPAIQLFGTPFPFSFGGLPLENGEKVTVFYQGHWAAKLAEVLVATRGFFSIFPESKVRAWRWFLFLPSA